MPVVSAPRLRLWPPSAVRSKPAAVARAWMMRATVPGSMAAEPSRGGGGGPSPRQGSREADQQQRAIAQPDEVIADRRQELAQDLGGGGEFLGRQLAAIGGVAADPGHGLGDMRLGGRHRAAGDEVQVAQGGAAQVDGIDAEAAAALGGQKGDDVGRARRQAGQGVAIAAGAPGVVRIVRASGGEGRLASSWLRFRARAERLVIGGLMPRLGSWFGGAD